MDNEKERANADGPEVVREKKIPYLICHPTHYTGGVWLTVTRSEPLPIIRTTNCGGSSNKSWRFNLGRAR